MTKPRVLAVGIGAAGLLFAGLAALSEGPVRWLCGWIVLACALASFAYLSNRPALLGKREGRLVGWRILPLAPYLLAYGIASWKSAGPSAATPAGARWHRACTWGPGCRPPSCPGESSWWWT